MIRYHLTPRRSARVEDKVPSPSRRVRGALLSSTVRHRMRFWIPLTLSVLAACTVSSCTHRHTPNLSSSVSAIRQYADSFEGLSMSEARSRLTGGTLSEEEWSEGGFGGKQLVATFPQYEVRVMFLEGKAITTSVQILSE